MGRTKLNKRCFIMKNGKYHVGNILPRRESKRKSEALVAENNMRLEKYNSDKASMTIQSSIKDTETLFKSNESKKNWKKRLITLATHESESSDPSITERTIPRDHEIYMTPPNEASNDELFDPVKDYSEGNNYEPSDDQSIAKPPDERSSEFRESNQVYEDNSDSNDSIWSPKEKMSIKKSLSIFKQQSKKLILSSDSGSSESSIDEDLYNYCRNIDPDYTQSINNILKLRQQSSNKLKRLQRKQPIKLRKSKPKIRKLNCSNTKKNDLNMKISSTPKKYIQFCITHVYTPVPYSKKLEDTLRKNGVGETMEILDNAVIEYMSSNAPLLHSTANITVFESDEMPKEEFLNVGVNHDLFKLRKNFEEFKNQMTTLLEENIRQLKEYCEDSQTFTQNKTVRIQETIKNSLPSKSLDDFLKFNDLLEKSLPHRQELKKMYAVVICGETSVVGCIRKIMKFTLSSAVESEYSGVGKKFRGVTKLNYSKTQTFHCLKDVLFEKFGLIPELKNLAGRVGQWLSGNADRESGRVRRTSYES